MTDPFKRGSAPGRERPEDQRPGTFEAGHKKHGGASPVRRTRFPAITSKPSSRQPVGSGKMATARMGSRAI
jgi:hypothetical protein